MGFVAAINLSYKITCVAYKVILSTLQTAQMLSKPANIYYESTKQSKIQKDVVLA